MLQYSYLSQEDFKKIYSDSKFRNIVACAHRYCEPSGQERRVIDNYPNKYFVTDEQMNEAKRLLKAAKEKVFNNHANDLLFCSMGCNYVPKYDDDVCNHRIRTEFLNKNGKRFFVEFGTGVGDNLRVDHSIDRDLEIEFEKKLSEAYEFRDKLEYKSEQWYLHNDIVKKYQGQPYNNYGGLERLTHSIKYTKANILNLVNETFECDFKNIIVDQYTIHPNDREIICKSPKTVKINKTIQLSLFD
jgi:hypothetical protein